MTQNDAGKSDSVVQTDRKALCTKNDFQPHHLSRNVRPRKEGSLFQPMRPSVQCSEMIAIVWKTEQNDK